MGALWVGWSFLEISSYKVWSTLHAVGTHKTHGTLLKATMEESQQAAAVFQLNCYTTPSVTLCISGLIPTISIVFIKLIRDLFWLFGSPTQANSSFPSFVERWYQISRHLDFQLNGLFMIKINSHHFKDFSGPANHTTQNETLRLRPG